MEKNGQKIPITLTNYEQTIQVYCREIQILEEKAILQERIECIKKAFLTSLEEDYRENSDQRIRLKNVVHSGRLAEICNDYFRAQRLSNKKKKTFCVIL